MMLGLSTQPTAAGDQLKRNRRQTWGGTGEAIACPCHIGIILERVTNDLIPKKGWRVFFFANEGNEPIHVHCKNGRAIAKFWIYPDEYDIKKGRCCTGSDGHKVNIIRMLP